VLNAAQVLLNALVLERNVNIIKNHKVQ